MKSDTVNPGELRAVGYTALADSFGPSGIARFFREFQRAMTASRRKSIWRRKIATQLSSTFTESP